MAVKHYLFIIILLLGLTNCVSPNIPLEKNTSYLPFEASSSLKTPRLSSTQNSLVLSWVDTSASITQLRFSVYRDKQWSQAFTAAKGQNWFVNYADYAAVTAIDEQHFIASWLEQSSKTGTQYQFKIKQSFDAGKTWLATTSPLVVKDGEHGFISVLKKDNDAFFTWISQVGSDYQILSSALNADNQWSANHVVDDSSCSCCHTDMAAQGSRVLSVYRNRTKDEIRDIALNSYQNQQWSIAAVIHNDGWKINGCPVNGPSISANEDSTIIVWHTFAKNIPQVKLLTQHKGRQSRVILLDEQGIGYTDSAIVDDEMALISWLSISDDVLMKIQAINLLDGSLGNIKRFKIDQQTIGFPSIAVFDEQLFVVNESDKSGIQIQQFKLNEF